MPGLTGPEVCHLVRQRNSEQYTYVLLLTSKSLKEDLIEGMESGADDYITKPFDHHELQARLRAGCPAAASAMLPSQPDSDEPTTPAEANLSQSRRDRRGTSEGRSNMGQAPRRIRSGR